jgi:hypothetical protein
MQLAAFFQQWIWSAPDVYLAMRECVIKGFLIFFPVISFCYIPNFDSRDWEGRCIALPIGSAWGIRDMQFTGLKKVKVEPALCTLRWLCHNDVRPTILHKWHRVFGELGALPKIREEIVSDCKWFSNFSVLCECCWWKLLIVRCKTLISVI